MMDNIPTTVLPLERKTWKPIVAEGEPSELSGSKFCGTACLTPGESYPECQNCGNPLQLFVQLNLSELPEEAKREFGAGGIVQLFYCTNEEPQCEVECDAWSPFSKSVLARLMASENINSENNPASSSLVVKDFPPKAIIGWEEHDDYPNAEELRSLRIELGETELDQYYDSDYPLPGDKLAGYPFWVQGVEYPNCPVCGEMMQLLFQIDSEDNVPFMFGDVGCAHLTQCPRHKEQLAFGWACG